MKSKSFHPGCACCSKTLLECATLRMRKYRKYCRKHSRNVSECRKKRTKVACEKLQLFFMYFRMLQRSLFILRSKLTQHTLKSENLLSPAIISATACSCYTHDGSLLHPILLHVILSHDAIYLRLHAEPNCV